jgi:tetratricopeptide (TPR) repeat protein
LEADPSFVSAYYLRGRLFVQQGSPERGLADLQKAVEMSGRAAEVVAYLGYCSAVLGKTQDALSAARELEDRYAQRKCSAYNVAKVYAGLNNAERVFEWLNKDLSDHSGWLNRLKADFEWDRYRHDPRFAEILKKVGFKE